MFFLLENETIPCSYIIESKNKECYEIGKCLPLYTADASHPKEKLWKNYLTKMKMNNTQQKQLKRDKKLLKNWVHHLGLCESDCLEPHPSSYETNNDKEIGMIEDLLWAQERVTREVWGEHIRKLTIEEVFNKMLIVFKELHGDGGRALMRTFEDKLLELINQDNE